MADSSHASSSSAAISVMLVSAPSRRSTRSSGGSTGARASRSRLSRWVAASLIAGRLLRTRRRAVARRARRCHRALAGAVADDLLQLLDGAVDEHLRGPVRAAQRPRDLAVVHTQGEAHDQRLATVVRELLHPVEHAAELVAAL